jgi:hypothetical protein
MADFGHMDDILFHPGKVVNTAPHVITKIPVNVPNVSDSGRSCPAIDYRLQGPDIRLPIVQGVLSSLFVRKM